MRAAGFWLILLALVAFWLFGDKLSSPEVITAPTAEVRDGDTLTIAGKTFRLYGIDAPEYRQNCADAKGLDWPCGKAARLQLAAYVTAGSLSCTVKAIDRYGRDVATCSSATVPDLAEAMVQSGLAISPAERGSAAYEEAETAAKGAARGIWQGAFIVPADWRTQHPRERLPVPVSKVNAASGDRSGP